MPSKVPPAMLSHELREATGPDLARRRGVIGLSFVGTTIGMIIGAY